MTWKQALDRAHSPAALDALAADAADVAGELAAELPAGGTLADLEARDAIVAGVLDQIDGFAGRAMGVRLDHALAADSSIATPTRKVFASTIVGYANDLGLLAQRARDVAARGGSADPDHTADLVVAAARSVLGLRDALTGPILALIVQLATAAIPDADRQARDRTLSDPDRRRWSAARRDLEAIAADPLHLRRGPMAARLAALPEQLDEPPAGPEVTFADMIEMD